MTFKELFDIIEKLIQGEYNPLDFSYDFPTLLIEHQQALEQENLKLFDEIQENFPDICAELEDEERMVEDFIGKVREEYERVKTFA